MTRTLVVLAAVSGLTMSTALAQAPASPSPAPATPLANSKTDNSQIVNSQIVNSQASDEWLASKLKGTTVVGSDDQKVGDIVDILLDKRGQVKAFIVEMGGILGFGARNVAIDLTQFHEMPAANGNKEQLKVAMTKEQLNDAADFKPLPGLATTTGAAPTGSRPAGSQPVAPPR